MKHLQSACSGLALALLVAACGNGGDDGGADVFFPEDYLATYTEVRNCRQSGDHDLNNIRILADPIGLSSYQNRDQNFPEGSVILKEEFDFEDRDCTGPIKQWTVMRRLADGTNPTTLDWDWQRLDPERQITGDNVPACYGCHTGCGVPPDGFDGTCAVP